MRHVAHASRFRARRSVADRRVEIYDRLLGRGPEFLILRKIWLHDPQADAFHARYLRRREPVNAEAGKNEQKSGRNDRQQHRSACCFRRIGEGRRACKRDQRNQREPPQTDHGCGLRKRRHGGKRLTEAVPREAGQHVPAQPFGDGHRRSESENTRRTGRPKKSCEQRSQAGEQGEPGGNRDHREGQEPAELVSLDEQRHSDPVEAGEEVAESEPPAGGECGAQAGTACTGPVDQPNEYRKRKCQDWP